MSGPRRLRTIAIAHSLFPPTTLKTAIRRLGFIQADPIRSPARAQDLILRHRVKGYLSGDLDRRYPALDIEEDVLYAYGFLTRQTWQLLHPRSLRGMSSLEKKVLETVFKFGVMHPTELQDHFGKARVVNDWGGYSKATTRALEHLHYRGLLRIARRENGVRLYERAVISSDSSNAEERLRKLILVIVNILGPISERSLRANAARFRYLGRARPVLQKLLKAGALESHIIDEIGYVSLPSGTRPASAPRLVRFLAPFDPLVWDRQRFEHLWGWPYRFEAYTPASKRVRGYYAMPLLWGDEIIGWANAGVDTGRLKVDIGFVDKRPTDSDFRSELENEIERLRGFLQLR